MINNLIVNALNPLGISVTYQKYSGTETTYITFFYYLIQTEDSSDDDDETTGYYVQLNLYYKSDIGDLKEQIVSNLKNNGFKKLDIRDFPYDTDTGNYWTAISVFYLENNN
ncbi:MAG: hypothetical protein K0S61_2962 [Anaerocolumna sp.]|jgi:hypothetical protein|nr:hypothetical protein [Anaerocolumna sp.]